MTEQSLSRTEIVRYSRHILLPQVGKAGQRKLKEASVLVIGTGGLGSPAAMYLAAAGVGRIGLVDFDVVDVSNLQRQIIHGESGVGTLKTESARRRLLEINPAVQVSTYDEPFTSENAVRILYDGGPRGYDVVVDCSDNFTTRYLTNDLCVLHGKPNVFGAIFRFDGQASVFDARKGPCYRCLFPEPPPPSSVLPCCVTGVLGVLPGTIGTLQATEAIKLILGIGDPLIGRLLLYSALDMTFDTVNIHKNPHCKICGEHPEITELIDYEAFCGVTPAGSEPNGLQEWHITPTALADRLQAGDSVQLLDVRQSQELEILHLDNVILIPLDELPRRMHELDREQDLVVICRSGKRAAAARDELLVAGFTRVLVLEGGMLAWQEQIDPSLPVY